MTCRKTLGGVETGDALELRDESGGCLPTAQTASGIEAAQLGLGSCMERVNLSLGARGRPVAQHRPAAVGGSETPKRLEPRGAE
jgi:hypothetical protein